MDACASIIAIAGTRDPENYRRDSRGLQNGNDVLESDLPLLTTELEEEFVCELPSGQYLPVQASDDQLQHLRQKLNEGELVSAETTIEGMVLVENIDEGNNTSNTVATLTSGDIILKPGSGQNSINKRRRNLSLIQKNNHQHRKLAVYEGQKQVLVVRVVDSNNLAHPDSPQTMSDKIFGTNGDSSTMTSQFYACSFGKLAITNDYSKNGNPNAAAINSKLSAPGVVEVKINVSLETSDSGTIRNAVTDAVNSKLGFTLPGDLDHVMYVLEACYVGCGWAAYAYVNSWNSVFQKNYYKMVGVQMHEIG